MRLLRTFPILCFALVLLSIVGLCVAQGSVGLLLMAGALAAISWYVTEGPRGRSLPKWVSNVLIIAVSLNVIVDLMQNPADMLGVLGRFALWLTLIKLYERRTPRDHAHLLALSLLLMLTGCLQSADLLFGVILLAYAALGLYVLLLFQLHASYERAREERVEGMPADHRLLPAAKPILGPHAALHFRSLTVTLAIGGLLLSAFVFAAFPRGVLRGEGGLLSAGSGERQRTAFVSEIDLRTGGRITDSRRTVMTLRLLDHAGRPFRVERPLLLRGAALTFYNGEGRWSHRPPVTTQTLKVTAGQPLPLVETDLAAPGLVRQVIDPLYEESVVFTAYAPLAIETGRDVSLEFDRTAMTFKRAAGSGAIRSYTVYGTPNPDDASLRELAASRAFGARTVRDRNEAIHDLARRLLADAGLPASPPPRSEPEARWNWNAEAARIFTRHLHSPAYRYTTDLSDIVYSSHGRVDPVEAFLFEHKRGHCEFFASALALLCNAVGVPARVATGYVAYEYDDLAQQYVVAESNAHAWTEVLTGPHRWTAFDPTSPHVLRDLHQPQTSAASRLRWLYDRFDGAWSRTIVSFDDAAQRQLAQRTWESTLTQRVQGFFANAMDWLEGVNRAFYFGPAGYLYVAFIGLVLIIFIVALVKVTRRYLRLRKALRLDGLQRREQRQMARQLGFYLDMLELLERARLSKPPWQPPLAFAAPAAALACARPDVAALVREVTSTFYEARYGGRRLTAEQLAAARAHVARLAESLHLKP